MEHKSFIERRNEKLKSPRKSPSKEVKKKVSSNSASNVAGSEFDTRPVITPPLLDKANSEEIRPEICDYNVDEKIKDLELIESLDFMMGENKLSIRFSKKHNRMYRIQVFLNDTNEIRPVTYSGASTGNTFWRLLKGILKK